MVTGVMLSPTGCMPGDEVSFSDDLDFHLNLGIWEAPADDLHQPYVQGTSVSIWMQVHGQGLNVLDAVPISTDESVFEIVSSWSDIDTIYVEGFARGPGSAELEVFASDDLESVIASAPLEVRAPDAIELHAAGNVLIGLDGDPADLDGATRIAVGGTTTFLVRYTHGGTRLYGNDVLEPIVVGPGISTDIQQTYLFENDEWLQLTLNASGLQEVELRVGGEWVETILVRGVSPEDVKSFELVGQAESSAHSGQILRVLARAEDGAGQRVHGMTFGWTLAGAPIAGSGDIYQYTYDPSAARTRLEANAIGLARDIDIRQSDGTLMDSNRMLGCSGGSSPSGSAWMVFVIAGLTVMAMRSRSNN
jgi:hypothetical protein